MTCRFIVRSVFTCASLGIFPSERQQVAAVAAPVRRDIRKRFETMGNPMVDFLLVRISLVVRFANTFRDHFRIALSMACILAIGTLHAGGVFEEVATEGATHNVVKLLRHELVSLFLVNFFFLLANGTLTVKTDIERSPVFQLFC
jgi:hypothetical protein